MTAKSNINKSSIDDITLATRRPIYQYIGGAAFGSAFDTDSKTNRYKFFAYSPWDGMAVLAGVAHLWFVVWFYLAIPALHGWQIAPLGLLYAVSISWNINSVSHNFLHNPYFTSPALNRAFSLVESLAIGFSQAFYSWVHMRHHSGNSDRPDAHGETVDWLSIYRHGEQGQPENVWRYTFLSFFRDDLAALYRGLYKQSPANARFGLFELACWGTLALAALWFDWRAFLIMLPFYYLGHCLSSLNGYFEHFGGNPDKPIAWGVSNYNRLYNWLWLNNGYHAEHHFRPRMHWKNMKKFHLQIVQEQAAAGVHVIHHCHALGFLDMSARHAAATPTLHAVRKEG